MLLNLILNFWLCLNTVYEPPIHLVYLVDKCLNLISYSAVVQHGFRQANCVADCLSKGHKVDGVMKFSTLKDLPKCCLGAFMAEFLGLANYRYP